MPQTWNISHRIGTYRLAHEKSAVGGPPPAQPRCSKAPKQPRSLLEPQPLSLGKREVDDGADPGGVDRLNPPAETSPYRKIGGCGWCSGGLVLWFMVHYFKRRRQWRVLLG
ncbi:hypothetical protein PG993_005604 [Apiospora rasikravindrae]|uniref:Uncharacterized protein n=1 Tax=Apiospora rasikravindrae TaxID=990691 RepID=A0ABR1TG16_9PEZI